MNIIKKIIDFLAKIYDLPPNWVKAIIVLNGLYIGIHWLIRDLNNLLSN